MQLLHHRQHLEAQLTLEPALSVSLHKRQLLAAPVLQVKDHGYTLNTM